ncbi:MAG: hypothetical protein ACO3EZ_02470 [Prochlorotrichaceae cyanobacterium]
MKLLLRSLVVLALAMLLCPSPPAYADSATPLSYPLTIPEHVSSFETLDVVVQPTSYLERDALQVELAPGATGGDRNTLVLIPGFEFHNGWIEVDIASTLQEDAPALAKGFVGVAFRVEPNGDQFEAFYLRPVNARSQNQLNRNHTLQYFAYPGYDFSRLREEAPGSYESYADMTMGDWVSLKIVVEGDQAGLYVNGAEQPALLVNDLKLGPAAEGTIALWVDVGTRAYFSNLTVTPLD